MKYRQIFVSKIFLLIDCFSLGKKGTNRYPTRCLIGRKERKESVFRFGYVQLFKDATEYPYSLFVQRVFSCTFEEKHIVLIRVRLTFMDEIVERKFEQLNDGVRFWRSLFLPLCNSI